MRFRIDHDIVLLKPGGKMMPGIYFLLEIRLRVAAVYLKLKKKTWCALCISVHASHSLDTPKDFPGESRG